MKFYQSFSKKWQKFVYKWSETSNASRDSSKPEVTLTAETQESTPEIPTEYESCDVIVSSTGKPSLISWSKQKRKEKDKNLETVCIKDGSVESTKYREEAGSSLSSLSYDSDNSPLKKRDDDTPQSDSEIVCKKSIELRKDKLILSGVKGSAKCISGRISVVSCPNLHPLKSGDDTVSDDSLDPTLSSDSGPNVGSYSGELSSLSDDLKSDYSEEESVSGDTLTKEKVSDQDININKDLISSEDDSGEEKHSFDREVSFASKVLNDFGEKLDDSVSKATGIKKRNVPDEETSYSIEERVVSSEDVTIISDSEGRTTCSSAFGNDAVDSEQHLYSSSNICDREHHTIQSSDDIIERRDSVASTASEGRGAHRVNRVVSSTLNQWRRFQGSLGNLTTSLRYRYQQKIFQRKLSKGDRSLQISVTEIDSKTKGGEEDLTEENYEQEHPLEKPFDKERQSSISLSVVEEPLQSQEIKHRTDELQEYTGDNLEDHDIDLNIDNRISYKIPVGAEEGNDVGDHSISEVSSNIQAITTSSTLSELVTPLSVSECTGDSSGSNSSGTTSSEGGDASIQSFLSVILNVKGKKVEETAVKHKSDTMEENRFGEKTFKEQELSSQESKLSPTDEKKMDYEVCDIDSSLKLDSKSVLDEVAGGEDFSKTLKSSNRRRISRQMSKQSRDSEDSEGEPLPKRPSLDVNIGPVQGDVITSLQQHEEPSSESIRSNIVQTRRHFCEGMMAGDTVVTQSVDGDGVDSENDMICDTSNVKDDNVAITSALEKNTHESLQDNIRPENVQQRLEICHQDYNSSDNGSSESRFNIRSDDSVGDNTLEGKVTLAEDRFNRGNNKHERKEVDENKDLEHDHDSLMSKEEEESQRMVSEASIQNKEGSRSSEGSVQELPVVEGLNVAIKKIKEGVKLERGLSIEERILDKETKDSERLGNIPNEEERDIYDGKHFAPQPISNVTHENLEGDFQSQMGPLAISKLKGDVHVPDIPEEQETNMDIFVSIERSSDDGDGNFCEENVLDLGTSSGPKIVVTGAVGVSSGTTPTIVLESGSVESGGGGSLEGVSQSQQDAYPPTSSSLAAHLAAHPRPPTPKSPITVDEWVAALPHPTSVDEEGEAWMGCEQGVEDLAEDLLNLGDEAGLMSGSGTRGASLASSLPARTKLSRTRESTAASLIIGAQSSELSTNVTGTREPTVTDHRSRPHGISLEQDVKEQPLSPSHKPRPITLTDVENMMHKRGPPASPSVDSRRSQFAALREKQTSFQSDLSGLSLNSRSSIDSLLDSRHADPIDVLLGLGFGSQSQEGISRIPERFLKPSQVRGNNVEAFMRSQEELSDRMESAEFIPGLDPQVLRRSSVTTVSPLMEQLLNKVKETRLKHAKDDPHHILPAQSVLRGANRFASVAKKIGMKSAVMNTFASKVSKLSVLNPENRRLLDLQGQKSPEVPRKRLIIGQSSFDLGRNGELLDIVAAVTKKNINIRNMGEDSLVEEEQSDDGNSSEGEGDDLEPRYRRHPFLQHKESVWSMASSATSIDSSEEELRDQRRCLQLALNRRPTPPDTPGTPSTPGDSLDSPTLFSAAAECVERRRKLMRRLSGNKRVSTVSSGGGSWDLDEKIPEEEMEEDSSPEVLHEQVIRESNKAPSVLKFSYPPNSQQTPKMFSDDQSSVLPKSVGSHQKVLHSLGDRVRTVLPLLNFTSQSSDSSIHRPDALKSFCALPELLAGMPSELQPGDQERPPSKGERRSLRQQRSIGSLRRQECVDDSSTDGNPLSPSMLQIPNYHPPHFFTDQTRGISHDGVQEDNLRTGNTGPLYRSGSAQSDSSGFTEGEVGDGETRNIPYSQMSTTSVHSSGHHAWWWSRDSACSVETVRHMPPSHSLAVRPSHTSPNQRARSLGQQPSCHHVSNSAGYVHSSQACRLHCSSSGKHRAGSLPVAESYPSTSDSRSLEYPLSTGSCTPMYPGHSVDCPSAFENCCTNITAAASSTVGSLEHRVCPQCFTQTSVPSFSGFGKSALNFTNSTSTQSGKGICCHHHHGSSSGVRQRRRSLPEPLHASYASDTADSNYNALSDVHAIQPPWPSPSPHRSKVSPPSSLQLASSSSDTNHLMQPLNLPDQPCSTHWLSNANRPTCSPTDSSLVSNQMPLKGSNRNRRKDDKATYMYYSQLDQDNSTPEMLLSALQSYRSQLVQQEHLSRTLYTTAALSSDNGHDVSQQLRDISAIRAAIRAEVTHMETLIANSKPNSLSTTCTSKVMVQMVALLQKQEELCHYVERLTLISPLPSPKSSDSSSKISFMSELSRKYEMAKHDMSDGVKTDYSSQNTVVSETIPHITNLLEQANLGPDFGVHSTLVSDVPNQANYRQSRASNSNVFNRNVTDKRYRDGGANCGETDRNRNSSETYSLKSPFVLKQANHLQDEGSLDNKISANYDKIDSECDLAQDDSQITANHTVVASGKENEESQWIMQLVKTQVQSQTQMVQTHLHQQSKEMEDIKMMLHLLLNKFQ